MSVSQTQPPTTISHYRSRTVYLAQPVDSGICFIGIHILQMPVFWLDGDMEQALNNIENIAYMIDSIGYMPNATSKDLLNRSQPPLFCQMVKDYYDATGDREFLARMIPILEKEYNFWMTRRVAHNGLNRYGHDATRQELIDFCNGLAHRVRVDPNSFTDETRIDFGAHLLAEAESGWDFNPRFNGRCMDYNPVTECDSLWI